MWHDPHILIAVHSPLLSLMFCSQSHLSFRYMCNVFQTRTDTAAKKWQTAGPSASGCVRSRLEGGSTPRIWKNE